MPDKTFDPFRDRLSRDIRNDLSRALAEALRTKSLSGAEQLAAGYLSRAPDRCYREYIENRLSRYAKVLPDILDTGAEPMHHAVILWNEQLFFEVHEILELAWMKEEGMRKLFLQAMIRAAGVYIKLDAGDVAPAARIAAKALPVLESNIETMSRYFKPEPLLDAMRNVSRKPPKLLP